MSMLGVLWCPPTALVKEVVKLYKDLQLNFDSSKSWGPFFYKSESPKVRIKFAPRAILACKNSPHNNNMISKWQRNETSSQPVCSIDHVFELSVLEISRFYCSINVTSSVK